MTCLARSRSLQIALFLLSVVIVPTPASASAYGGFIGLWEGIDPLDGANMQRSIVLTGENNYTITGRIEFSQICGSNLAGNITEKPDVTEAIIPAVLNGYGQISTDDDSKMAASLAITCFGEDAPRIASIGITYELGSGMVKEIPGFRPDDPIYMFRVSSAPDTSATSSAARLSAKACMNRLLAALIGASILPYYLLM